MDLESAGTGVLLVAVWMLTNKRFKARVGKFVRLQVAFGDKLLPTLSAGEGSLARVCPHVGLKVARLLELLQTTLVRTN